MNAYSRDREEYWLKILKVTLSGQLSFIFKLLSAGIVQCSIVFFCVVVVDKFTIMFMWSFEQTKLYSSWPEKSFRIIHMLSRITYARVFSLFSTYHYQYYVSSCVFHYWYFIMRFNERETKPFSAFLLLVAHESRVWTRMQLLRFSSCCVKLLISIITSC